MNKIKPKYEGDTYKADGSKLEDAENIIKNHKNSIKEHMNYKDHGLFGL